MTTKYDVQFSPMKMHADEQPAVFKIQYTD